MNNNSIIESYVSSLFESDKLPSPKKAAGPAVGDLDGPTDKVEPKDNLENTDLETPETPEQLQGISEEGVKTIDMKKLNAFDRLFKRAINEDFGEDDNMSMGSDNPAGDQGGADDDLSDDGLDSDEGLGDKGDGDVTFTLDRATAEKLHEVLGSVLGGGSEDFGSDDLGGDSDDEYSEYEDDEDEEPVTEEEIDAEVHGHALVDDEKLNKGLNKPGNRLVKGAVPNPGGKAETGASGKKSDGKLTAHPSKGESLQGKDNKVPSRNSNVGKFALED